MGLLNRMRGSSLFGRKRSFRKSQDGVTAIEFAMVGPIFFLMLGVTLETGIMMFTEYVLQTSVQEAARVVRTGQAHEQKMSAAKFKEAVCRLTGKMVNCNSKVTVYLDAKTSFDALASSTPSYLTIGPADDGTSPAGTYNCGLPGQSVALIATYDWNFYIPYFMNYFGNKNGNKTRRMAGFAMFQNEPYPYDPAKKCA
jgi:Flp pilus assembly protein TadG